MACFEAVHPALVAEFTEHLPELEVHEVDDLAARICIDYLDIRHPGIGYSRMNLVAALGLLGVPAHIAASAAGAESRAA